MKAGSMLFMRQCSDCHTLEAIDGLTQKGPSLGIIYNRTAGSNTSYPAYSDSLLKAGFFWNPLNLFKFMADPSSLVKGTTCGLIKKPIKNEEDRADLIALFREFTREMKFYIKLKEIQRVGYTQYQSNLHAVKEEKQRGRLIE